jgi:hypothetical protein
MEPFDSLGSRMYLDTMKNNMILLAGIILLYLIPSMALQAIYGPSYGFLSGEDCWNADGHGGWVKHGNPSDPMPSQPSRDIPPLVRYIPIFLPAALLILFYLTPLSKKLEPPLPPKEPVEPPGPETPTE